jgi:hypothetical protein
MHGGAGVALCAIRVTFWGAPMALTAPTSGRYTEPLYEPGFALNLLRAPPWSDVL